MSGKSADIRSFFNLNPSGASGKSASKSESENTAPNFNAQQHDKKAVSSTSRFFAGTEDSSQNSNGPAKRELDSVNIAAKDLKKPRTDLDVSADPKKFLSQKFSRSSKTLVKPKAKTASSEKKDPVAEAAASSSSSKVPTKKESKKKSPPKEQDQKPIIIDDFDEFDDFQVDESLNEVLSSAATPKTSQRDSENVDEVSFVASSPSKLEKKSTPLKSVKSPVKQQSPAVKSDGKETVSPKLASTSITPEKHSNDREKEPEEQKSEKKGFAYHKFMAKSGPIAPGSKPLPVGQDNCLAGMSFVFTGELDSTSRDDAVDLVKRYGGRVVTAPSSRTSYVVVGREPGESKLKKIEQLKLKTLDEDGLFALIESQPSKTTSTEKKASPKSPNIRPSKSIDTSSSVKPRISEMTASKSEPTIARTQPADKNELWTVKYAPKNLHEIVGNKTVVDSIIKWLHEWKRSLSSGEKAMKAVLISGPPGIGKTTAAHIIAKECGYEAIEMNASDVRSKSLIDQIVGELTETRTISEFFHKKDPSKSKEALKKNHLLIMDECDGMGAGDRGGMAELIKIIKHTKIPIICICNDRMNPKVRSLANHCIDARFHRPTAQMIRNRIMGIARQEGLSIESNALDQLFQCAHSDIRQLLNTLQTWNLRNSSMNYDESKKLSGMSKKNIDLGPFELVSTLMSASQFRSMSMEEKNQIYFSDYQLVPPFVQENYIRMKPAVRDCPNPRVAECVMMDKIAGAAETISDGDLVDSMIYGKQEFTLMPIHAMFSTIKPVAQALGPMNERLCFPSILGQISKTNKGWRILKELHLHMSLPISADKNQTRLSYFPVLLRRLSQPLAAHGADAIEQVIKLMDDYYLSKEDWDNMMEIGLGPLEGTALLKSIPASVKTAFTRTYNKNSHPTVTVTDGKKKVATGSSSKLQVDLEDAIDADDMEPEPEAEDEEESAEKEAAAMQVKKKSSTATSSSKSSAKASSSAAGAKKRAASSSSATAPAKKKATGK